MAERRQIDDLEFDEPADEGGSEFHLSEYLGIVVKRARLIALCVAIALSVAAIRSLMAKPTYRAVATLDIGKDQSTPYDVSDRMVLYSWWDPEYLPTQTRLIKSREIAERVIRRLNLLQNPDFNPSARETTSKEELANADARVTGAAVGLQGGITVTPIRGTNLVEVSFIGTSPTLAADIANSVAESYIDWKLETKYSTLDKAGRFIGSQIEQLKSEIAEKERELQAYGREKGIVSAERETNATLQNLESLNKDYAAAVADRVAKQARFAEYQNARPESLADNLSPVVASMNQEQSRLEREYAEKLSLFKPEWPAMQQLKAQIDKGRLDLDAAVRQTVTNAREAARTEYLTALRREQGLQGVLRGQKGEAMDLNSASVEYNNLFTEVQTKRELMDGLLQRQNETEMTARLQSERVSNIRIVDRAIPPGGRFSPSYTRNMAVALMLGLFAGVGIAFLLEYLDRSLRTIKQVEQFLKLPALGLIPMIGASALGGYGYSYGYGYGSRKRKKKAPKVAATPLQKETEGVSIELLPHTQPRSTVAEAYRAIRTALLLSRAGGVRTLVVSSSLPGEGKTSTSANLAVVLAQLNKRVLLIDADLHKPRQHEIFRVSNRAGLVSALAENIALADVIVATPIPGLDLMPAGPLSPNPSGLLASEAMTTLLAEVAATYDYVLIDSPPVSAVADAIVIGSHCDGMILCVEGGRTPREIVARVRDKLLRANVRILGVLINNLEEKAYDYGYYHNYYTGAYGTA
ncbi:MAG: polysaccharide biosynthesis tyrosine autokinase, partial [Thermoanaerobaculia bacterium]|nr:polysaccharide biosynthesis tyrosine autokinase [Thermoanaerobaculia bacterium]